MNELDINFNFDLGNFDLEIDLDLFKSFNNRYIKPPICKEIKEQNVKYEYAKKMALEIKPAKNMRIFATTNGSFIFGDFIEAFIVENDLKVKELTISTLSLSENNVDSLANLLDWGYVTELNLIVSGYFFSHEKYNLIPYIYKCLDKNNVFQLAGADTHCKICIFETESNEFYVIHGSANLRTSGCLEQFVIEENKELYDFNYEYQKNILETYKTINKPLRSKKLWQTVHQAEEPQQ